MRITITDNEGTVFASHQLDGLAAAYVLRQISDYRGDQQPEDVAGEEAAENALTDLATACRNEIG